MSLILTSLLARFGTHLAIGAGLLVGFLAWQKRIEVKAVAAERVRVETTGNNIDAAAQKKRERVERAPPNEIDAALRRYCRDC
jgi:cell division protein FtsB